VLRTTPAKRVSPFSCRNLATSVAVALAGICLSAGSAQAVVVTVDGVQYDVTTFTGSYDSDTNKFQTPDNGGVMPWWGSESTANAFAAAVGSSLGEPNTISTDTFGPIFAVRSEGGAIFGRYYGYNGSNTVNDYFRNSSDSRVWAQVGPADPVPAPLPVLGSAAALGFCRRLRSRSQRLRHAPTPRLA
jgi:hypothetical protein